jgi:hypothetical protein
MVFVNILLIFDKGNSLHTHTPYSLSRDMVSRTNTARYLNFTPPSPLFFSGQLIEGSPGQFFAEENDGINPTASSSITLKN